MAPPGKAAPRSGPDRVAKEALPPPRTEGSPRVCHPRVAKVAPRQEAHGYYFRICRFLLAVRRPVQKIYSQPYPVQKKSGVDRPVVMRNWGNEAMGA